VIGGTIGFTALVTDHVGATDEANFELYIDGGYICGDINGSGGTTDISDIVFLADYFFGGGPPPPVSEAADVDGSGSIDISDLTYIVSSSMEDRRQPADETTDMTARRER